MSTPSNEAKWPGYKRERLACAWFFGAVGLVYGIFTSRLPALKAMSGANDAQIGFLLLAMGSSALCGLLFSGFMMERAGPKKLMAAAALFSTVAMIIAGLSFSYWQLLVFCMLYGLGNGFCDVAMNAQGMTIERRYDRLCMSSLHASFSLGGVLGSASGSVFAAFELSPFWNLLLISAAFMTLLPWAYKNTVPASAPGRKAKEPKQRLPLFVYFLGCMAMLCYVSEGSVGEWGSVLLHSVKRASQQEAALVFGCFCVSMVIGRFFGDRLRVLFGAFRIVLFGSLISGAAMAVVLLSAQPAVCLCAYAVMGIGFAPVVPILYSLGGRVRGVSPSRASSAISVLAYSGILFFPPFLGMLGQSIGLGRALWIIVGSCACVSLGSFFLRCHVKS